jgi:hypothetical protein
LHIRVAGIEVGEHFEKLPAVAVRSGDLLSVDVPARASGRAKLLKLGVEGLPVGADAGVADNPLMGQVQAKFPKLLTNASHDHTGQKAGVLSLRLLCAPRAVMQ